MRVSPLPPRDIGTLRAMAGATRWLDQTERDAWRGMVEVMSRLMARLDDELERDHGISLPEYEVLVQLSEAPDDTMRMTDLAERALVSRSGLTRRIDGLERRGLVVRMACPSDRRGANAVLTPEGRKLLEAAAPTHVEGVRRLFIDQLTKSQVAALAEAFATVKVPGEGRCPGER